MWDDDWTAVTADGKRTAQFEHTILVTDDGVEVLTAATAPCRRRRRGPDREPKQRRSRPPPIALTRRRLPRLGLGRRCCHHAHTASRSPSSRP